MCTCRLDEMLLESRSVLEGLDVLMANVSLTRMHVHRYIYMLMLWANCVYIHNFVQPTFVEVVSESLIGEVKDAVTNMVCTCTCTCCTQSSFLTQHLSLSLFSSLLSPSLPPHFFQGHQFEKKSILSGLLSVTAVMVKINPLALKDERYSCFTGLRNFPTVNAVDAINAQVSTL